jgi:hypothetical protein
MADLYLAKNSNSKHCNKPITIDTNMKYKLSITAGAIVALVSLSSVVQATPIAGSIGFTGTFVQNGGTMGDLTTATSMNINSTTIGTATGSFAGASLISFTTPIAVNPPTGLTILWSVLVGTTTYTFVSLSEAQNLTTPAALHLLGTGVIHDGNSADDTTGTWQLGFGVSGDSFQWQSTAASVGAPDGGSTVLLLGAALTSLTFLKIKARV